MKPVTNQEILASLKAAFPIEGWTYSITTWGVESWQTLDMEVCVIRFEGRYKAVGPMFRGEMPSATADTPVQAVVDLLGWKVWSAS